MSTPPPPATPSPSPHADPPLTLDLVKALIAASGKTILASAAAAVPVPTVRPGAVQGVTFADRTASVLMDGDTVAITAQVWCELPYPNARVMVMFVPPSAVFVVGFVGACGVPPGSLQAYSGPITNDAGAAATSATPGEPPAGWLWCHGQAISRSTYSALFAAISTTYGVGDGTTTFAVPDLRGRFVAGVDAMGGTAANVISGATLATTGGSTAISQANLPAVGVSFTPAGSVTITSVTGTVNISDPSHVHGFDHSSGGFSAAAGSGAIVATGNATVNTNSATTGITASLSGGGGSGTFSGTGGTTSNLGSGSAYTQPYMAAHYLIKC